MSAIHPTAIIHPTVQFADDLVVGPYAIIEENAVIGVGTRIEAHAQILRGTCIGENCSIGRSAIIGGDPQSVAFDCSLPSQVVLGNGNRVREFVTIHRSMYEGGATKIGDNNFFMTGSHLGHDVTVENSNVIANNVLLAGHVQVGSNCFFGGGSVFHQFIRVGDYALTQGVSGFSMDVPPYVVASGINKVQGINVIGLKRAGFDSSTRFEIKRAFDLIYRSGNNLSQAIAAARKRSWVEAAEKLIHFIESRGKKGICPLGRRVSE